MNNKEGVENSRESWKGPLPGQSASEKVTLETVIVSWTDAEIWKMREIKYVIGQAEEWQWSYRGRSIFLWNIPFERSRDW